jgi:rhamnose utilization protein RhaD (predicted bifunctional aldolase and dehydrogenase)/NAD(P)-dependent dehydrogenase (short-subunit alcohol dehydrogenase family)
MKNRWSDDTAAQFIKENSGGRGEDLALGLYVASLIGAEPGLVLHGGGNSSVKTAHRNLLGEEVDAIYVKASGYNMACIDPNGYTGLDLQYLHKLRTLSRLSDVEMAGEFRTHSLDAHSAPPSIETLVHAFVPYKFVNHTHPDAILALTNQRGAKGILREALGKEVAILEYVTPGFHLAKAVASEFEKNPDMSAMVLMQHGLLTWSDRAKESYRQTIKLVSLAEKYLKQNARNTLVPVRSTPLYVARKRLASVAPLIRGLMAQPTGDPDRPWERVILQPLIRRDILNFVDSDRGKKLALTPPLTADHLIRTKSLYMWVDNPSYDNPSAFHDQFSKALGRYAAAYDAYIKKYIKEMPEGVRRMDSFPRVILLPGMGVICAGKDTKAAAITRDIAAHTLAAKAQIAAMGRYQGLQEKDLFAMEYRTLQHAKLKKEKSLPLSHEVALITGAAGAIGSGIAQVLLEKGCHVAVTDLEGEPLSDLAEELKAEFGSQVMSVPLDVTNPKSIEAGFAEVSRAWGGVDLIVLNAGIAHVSPISKLSLDAFQKLETINVEGTLLVLAEAARHFMLQNTGGDIVMVSTKNVFAPGANFGAYSATKAAGHQLARIASQEFASMDVRVNMVSPDAVFSHGARRSGLWMEIGPERMSARGLSAEGLEEYYRNRNLLKATVTARHVGNAVLYFAMRQTPTTGATIPVDGGLPDSTPR